MSALISTPEHIERFRLICLKQGLQMYSKFKMLPTKTVNATKLLKLASAATGKAYKRGQHAQAALDVAALVETLKAKQ
jgi:hypothetical protein